MWLRARHALCADVADLGLVVRCDAGEAMRTERRGSGLSQEARASRHADEAQRPGAAGRSSSVCTRWLK